MLQIIAENTAKVPYVAGKYNQNRWFDLIDIKPKDKRTGKEIASDVIKNAGLRVVKQL